MESYTRCIVCGLSHFDYIMNIITMEVKTSSQKPLEQSNFSKLTWNSNPISDIKMDVLNIFKWLCVCSFTCEQNFSNEKCFNGFSLIYYSIFFIVYFFLSFGSFIRIIRKIS